MNYSPTKTHRASAPTANSTAGLLRRWNLPGVTYPKAPTNADRARMMRQKRLAKGLCYQCARPSIDGWRCQEHREKEMTRRRIAYRLAHGIDPQAPKAKQGRPRKYL